MEMDIREIDRKNFINKIEKNFSEGLIETLQLAFKRTFTDINVEQIAFAISEPNAGSDLSQISTIYDPILDQIDGLKTWVGLPDNSTHLITIAKTPSGDMKTILIERNVPGIEVVDLFKFQGFGFNSGTIKFNKVTIGKSGIIMEYKKIHELFDITRGMVGLLSEVLIGQFYHFVYNYANNRKLDMGYLIESPLTRNRLRFIHEIQETISFLNSGNCPNQIETIIIKIISSEWLSIVADLTQQIIGARAFRSDTELNELILSSRFLRIGEGPTEVLTMQLGNLLFLNGMVNQEIPKNMVEPIYKTYLYTIGHEYLLNYIDSITVEKKSIKLWIEQQRLYLKSLNLTISDKDNMMIPSYKISHLTNDPLFRSNMKSTVLPEWLVPLLNIPNNTIIRSKDIRNIQSYLTAAIIICKRMSNYSCKIHNIIDKINGENTIKEIQETSLIDRLIIDSIIFPLDMEIYSEIPQMLMLQEMISDLASRLETIDKETRINEIGIITEKQKSLYNKVDNHIYQYDSFLQAWDMSVQKYPHNIAIKGYNINGKYEEMTYKHVDQMANQMGNYLIKMMNPNISYKRIGIMCQHHIELIIGILAIFKLGSAILPIPHTYPNKRVIDMCHKSDVNLVIVDNDLLVDQSDIYVIGFPQFGRFSQQIPDQIYQVNEAYITFTSGTTGKPKGVINSHIEMMRYLEWLVIELNLNDSLKVLHTASIGFDIFTMEIFTPLMCGGSLIMAGQYINQWNPTVINNLIYLYDIKMLVMSPSQINSLTDVSTNNGLDKIEYIYTGGAPMPQDLRLHLKKCYPKLQLIGFYGVTEASNSATVYFYNNYKEESGKIGVPIGKVFGGKNIVILDQNNQILPPGLSGQITLVGFGVANGYLNDIEKTKEKFIIWENKNAYLTGDKGFMENIDGEYRYQKRMDRQAKINGIRFEPEEIEVLIMTNLSIRMVAITVTNNQIHLYIAKQENSINMIKKIIILIKENLPSSIHPSFYHIIETFPLNINGKIDHQKLGEKEYPSIDLNNLDQSPNESQEIIQIDEKFHDLKILWEEITSAPLLNIDSKFIYSGGNSMRFASLSIKIMKLYDLEIYDKFPDGNPSFRQLMELISSKSPNMENHTPESFLATPSQLNLFVASAAINNSVDPYLIMEAWSLNDLDMNKLEKVMNRIEEINPWLKSTFYYEDTSNKLFYRNPSQISSKFKLECYDIALELNPSKWIESFRSHKFDLSGNDRLYRVIIGIYTSKSPESPETFKCGQKDFPISKDFYTKSSSNTQRKYIIIFMTHHILVDGIGLQYWFEQIYHLYNDKNIKKYNNWSPGKYSEWFDKTYNIQNDIEYWAKQIIPSNPIIPGDIHNKTIENEAFRYYIPSTILEQLDQSCILEGNKFSKLLSTYLILLNRYHPDQILSIAFPVHGRYNSNIQTTISNFTNTLVLISQIDTEKTINEYHQIINNQIDEIMSHQRLPYHLLPNKIKYQGFFSFFGKELLQVEPFKDQNSQRIQHDSGSAKSNLSVFLVDSDGGITGFVEYLSSKYSLKFIEDFLNGWVEILQMSSDTIIKNIGLDQAKREKVLDIKNKPIIPKHLVISEAVYQMSLLYPDLIALRMNERSLTYKDMETKADIIAKYIISKSSNRSASRSIAIFTERSIEQIVAAYAILKIGTYIPINPDYPDSRVKYILEDAKVSLVIVDHTTIERVKPLNIDYWSIDNLDKQLSKMFISVELPIINPQDICYIIYTSGTTGNPKGVMITHQSVMYMTYNTAIAICQSGPGTVYSYFHSIAFDFSVFEIWSPLSIGGQVVIIDYMTTRNTDDFYQTIQKMKINVLSQTPSAFYMFSQIDQERKFLLPDLKCVVFGGEALRPHLLKDWIIRHPLGRPRLINMYGITEITVHATYHELTQGDIETNNLNGCIGYPLWDGPIYICYPDNLKITPPYIPGEILVGGHGVALGYLNLQDFTEKKFITHQSYGRVYRSGDFGYYDWDGKLYYIGRRDDQVKIRGYRIELGDIISQLSKIPNIKAVHIGVRKSDERSILVAYIAHKQFHKISSNILTEEIVKQLDGKLPNYMIPNHFLYFDDLPINSSGKVDHRKLSEIPLDNTPKENENMEVIPKSPTMNVLEDIIRKVWIEVLKKNNISNTDNFYRLGGDSMAAIKISAILREKYKIKFKSSDLNIYPTIQDILPHVMSEQSESNLEPFALLTPEEHQYLPMAQLEDAYPATQLQLGLLYNINSRPDSDLYIDIFLYKWKMSYNQTRIENTIRYLINRFRLMRTNFMLNLTRPLQLVYKPEWINPEIYHITVNDHSNVEEILKEAQILRRKKFDQTPLSNISLFKFVIVKYANDNNRFALAVIFSHAVCEGWSAMILCKSFQEYYLDQQNLNSSDISCNNCHMFNDKFYNHYVSKELKTMQDSHHIIFWKDYLKDYQYCRLPTDKSLGMMAELKRGRLDIPLSEKGCNKIRLITDKYNISIKTIFLYFYIKWLSLQTGQLDITTSTVINNRLELSGCDETIGLYLSTLPIRLKITNNDLNDIGRLNEDLNKLEKHKMLPLNIIMQNVSQGHLIFETAFNYIAFPFYRQSNYLEELIQDDATEFSHSLTLLKLSETEIIFKFDFDLQTSNVETQHLMAKWIESQLDLFPQSNLLTTISPTHHEYYFPENYFYQQFIDIVDKYPERKAIITETGEIITYSQLYNYISHTVNYLNETYPYGDILVWDQNTSDSVIALYSCLFSGHIYLPIGGRSQLNPNWPLMKIIKEDKHLPLKYVKPNNVIYMIYTSGTTAQPKLVQIPPIALYYSLINRVNYYKYNLENPINFIMTSSTGYDSSLVGLFMPLIGQTLICTNNSSIDNILRQSHIADSGLFTPDLYDTILTSFNRNIFCKSSVILAGQDVSENLVKRHYHKYPNVKLYNEYGPTECCIWAFVGLLTDQVHIGKPIDNINIRIISDDMIDCQQGQLVLSGPQLMIGYYPDNSPIKDYITGDIISKCQDVYKWRGRIDRQIKRHGHRIDLEEITAVLKNYIIDTEIRIEYINNMIIVVIKSKPINNIKEQLQKYLHPIMLPNRFIFTDKSPIDIDINENLKSRVNYLENNNSLLLKTWRNILNNPHLSITDNLHSYGATSISYMKVAAMMSYPIDQLIKYQSVEEQLNNLHDHPINSINIIQQIKVGNPNNPIGIIAIHPVSGYDKCYYQFTELNFSGPIYSIKSPKLIDNDFSVSTLKELAEFYIAQSKKIIETTNIDQWILIGWSFGGLISMEMAKILSKRIHSVYLLDSVNPIGVEEILKNASPINEQIAAIHRPILDWHINLNKTFNVTSLDIPVTLIKARPDPMFSTKDKRELYTNNWKLPKLVIEWIDVGHYELMNKDSGVLDLLNTLFQTSNLC